jgi:hypothetical protein
MRTCGPRLQARGPCPGFVRYEFEAYLRCGRFEHGFLRVKCGQWHHEHLVAFSCKCRGFFPSCSARRMAETGEHLVDYVFPGYQFVNESCRSRRR